MELLNEIFNHTITITTFVMVTMLMLEYITVQTHGDWSKVLQKNAWLQIILAALLGILPGCIGILLVVSFYTHRVFGFAALMAGMIATTGDEAFVMLAEIPADAVKILALTTTIGIITGFVIQMIMGNKSFMKQTPGHLHVHDHHHDCVVFQPKMFVEQLKKISFHRFLLISGIILFSFLSIGTGVHDHGAHAGHDHGHQIDWEQVSFLVVMAIGLFIVLTVPDHFLTDHLWNHTVRKHFPKIFLWTFGALAAIHIGMHYMSLNEASIMEITQKYQLILLLIAIAVGIIPESGPHLIFIFMFADGLIPFSILLANSVVQDGHGSIPLLAEAKKTFVVLKIIKIVIGLIIGLLGIWFVW